ALHSLNQFPTKTKLISKPKPNFPNDPNSIFNFSPQSVSWPYHFSEIPARLQRFIRACAIIIPEMSI
ncbi:hypothetical protein, partial [Ligilactobacillus agilis]|uniref:hypothetical protein n=1 Tax=Ligilactobacillus agilis TaxID=1601 RepID=UPI001CDAC987